MILSSSSLIRSSDCSSLVMKLSIEFFSVVILSSVPKSLFDLPYVFFLLDFTFCSCFFFFWFHYIVYLCSFVASWESLEKLFWILCQAIHISPLSCFFFLFSMVILNFFVLQCYWSFLSGILWPLRAVFIHGLLGNLLIFVRGQRLGSSTWWHPSSALALIFKGWITKYLLQLWIT